MPKNKARAHGHTYEYVESGTAVPSSYQLIEVRNSRFLADHIASLFLRSTNIIVREEKDNVYGVYVGGK
mgnify:CR=1 FL=1